MPKIVKMVYWNTVPDHTPIFERFGIDRTKLGKWESRFANSLIEVFRKAIDDPEVEWWVKLLIEEFVLLMKNKNRCRIMYTARAILTQVNAETTRSKPRETYHRFVSYLIIVEPILLD